ncbi:ETS-related transcription factor Elf-3-like isoform X2 [Haliotis rufescens]|uniref:ETS-related transcription factor Elf-3-like isoform X2 n=1 Tax=Haliotis rufescens TaxID=6454 RepID=UPI00201EB862|nr:ETS-related transcription factor Elf-3-like isoform X2 [Haliotis rufescens]
MTGESVKENTSRERERVRARSATVDSVCGAAVASRQQNINVFPELKFRLLSPSQHVTATDEDCTSMPSASPQYSYPVSDYGYPVPQNDCFHDNGFQSGYDPFTQLTAMAAEQNFTGSYHGSQCPSPNYSMQQSHVQFPASVASSPPQYFTSGMSCRFSSQSSERRSCDMESSSDSCSRNNSCKKSYPSHTDEVFEDQDSFLSWTRKHPEHWNCKEVLDWLFYLGQEQDLNMSQLRAEAFQDLTGSQLCNMTADDFLRIDPKFGKLFYEMLRKLLLNGVIFSKPTEVASPDLQDLPSFTPGSCDSAAQAFQPCNSPVYTNLVRKQDQDYTDGCIKTERQEALPCSLIDNMAPYFDFDPADAPQLQTNTASDSYHPDYFYHGQNYTNSTSVRNTYSFPGNHFPQQLPRRRPGRPRVKSIPDDGSRSQKDKKVKNQHLWEFIYEALLNPMYNPLYLRWENQREGVFRFVQSEAVAQLWGALKNNDNMTYEKLSRAMRHYYKRGILERVEGRRLVYKFSRKAMERVREKRNSV